MNTIEFVIMPGGHLSGSLRVAGDKSISHRAIMLTAIAQGSTLIKGFLEGEDTLATLAAFRAMGVTITGPSGGEVRLQGVGLRGLKAPANPLNLGNSGTSMRLLAGLLAGQPFAVALYGDASLSRRPMARVTQPLKQMGAHIETAAEGRPPLKIQGNPHINGIDYYLPVASAQVKSALLLAGLYAQGNTCVTEPAPTRDHTERLLASLGYHLAQHPPRVCLQGGGQLQAPAMIEIPADISSAAFFMVGASIAPGSELLLSHVGVNPTRCGIITLLQQMGADIQLLNQRQISGEPVADIRVKAAPLHGIEIPPEQVPLAIDEFPALLIAAACAQGQTRLSGAAELRVKESDRIDVMATGLQQLGIQAQPSADGIVIQGGRFQGGHVDSQGDHRIAMAFAMAALNAQGHISISDCGPVKTSFPDFVACAQSAGLAIQVK